MMITVKHQMTVTGCKKCDAEKNAMQPLYTHICRIWQIGHQMFRGF